MIIDHILQIWDLFCISNICPFLVLGWVMIKEKKKIYSLSLTLAPLDCHSLWQGKESSAASFYDKNSILSYVF